MRAIRRNDHSPRVELIPLIDVIFLLLTFFVYSLLVMVRADVLPVKLTSLATGQAAKPQKIHAITIDAHGQLFLDRKPIAMTQLEPQLTQLAGDEGSPQLYLAMEDEGATDRGPTLIRLIEMLRAAGLTDFVIVGQPQESKDALP